LQAELAAWQQAGAESLELVERRAWPERAKLMKSGDVWRVRLPTVPGHTQAGIRPAVIVQEDQATLSLPTVLIVPFTSTQGALRFPGTLAVSPDGQNGLTVPSVALVFQLTAIDKTNCLQHLGVLDPATLDQIFEEPPGSSDHVMPPGILLPMIATIATGPPRARRTQIVAQQFIRPLDRLHRR
jgi:mRNA interferase MazF